jgi:hypothetical protein
MPTASARDLAGDAAVLAAKLAESDSATIYTEVPGLDEDGATALLGADPPLHVEFDQVRQLWAVRLATPEEVAEAQAAAAAAATAAVATRTQEHESPRGSAQEHESKDTARH